MIVNYIRLFSIYHFVCKSTKNKWQKQKTLSGKKGDKKKRGYKRVVLKIK